MSDTVTLNGVTVTGAEVRTVTFSHPKANALSSALMEELTKKLALLGSDHSCSVVILQSSGIGAFCAGAFFDELASLKGVEEAERFFNRLAGLLATVVELPVPVIARVQGKAVGGGVGLLSSCDYVVAADSASVRLSELWVGIAPKVISPVVERKIGLANLAALSLDGRERDSAWCLANGLFSSVVPSGKLEGELREISGELVKVPRSTLVSWKETLRTGSLAGTGINLRERLAELGKSGAQLISNFRRPI